MPEPSDLPTFVGPKPDETPLHYCQYSHAGVPLSASYPLTEDMTDIPSGVRAAYGVRPHADMPDGIYSRMDQRLAADGGAAGYYYCTTPQGDTTWISVSLYPTSKGIIACHFEVTSPKLRHLGAFFAQLKAAERAHVTGDDAGLIPPEKAAEQLLELLASEGVADYRSLALQVMTEEVFRRYHGQNRPQFHELLMLNNIVDALMVIDQLGGKVGAISERSKLIPYQLKLQAARFESGTGPIGVIASNHQELTGSLLGITQDIHDASNHEIAKVADAMAYLAQSNHAAELIAGGPTCRPDLDLDAGQVAELREIIDDCDLRVSVVLANIDKSAAALIDISKRMRRALSAMEMTRFMCKVEQANINGPTEGLQDIVRHLHEVETRLYNVMVGIEDSAKKALNLVKCMDRLSPRHAA